MYIYYFIYLLRLLCLSKGFLGFLLICLIFILLDISWLVRLHNKICSTYSFHFIDIARYIYFRVHLCLFRTLRALTSSFHWALRQQQLWFIYKYFKNWALSSTLRLCLRSDWSLFYLTKNTHLNCILKHGKIPHDLQIKAF